MPLEPSFYNVVESMDVVFLAKVGEGQLASVVVNGEPAQEIDGHFMRELGAGGALKSTELEIEATVVRVNPLTDRGSLTFVLFQRRPSRPDTPQRRFREKAFPEPPLEISFSQGEEQRLVSHTISLI